MGDITIVTAFFDIGRGNWTTPVNGREIPHYIPRTTDTYFNYFRNLAKVKNDMVIFCDKGHVDLVRNIRNTNAPGSKTTIFDVDFNETVKDLKAVIEMVQSNPAYVNLMIDPHMPEYWNADYVLVNLMKTDFVLHAYAQQAIKTDLVAWLDFGYVRGESTLPKNLVWKYDFDSTKMHYFNKRPIDMHRPIFDIIRHNDVYIMGCHLVGGQQAWIKHKEMNTVSLKALLRCGLIDDDQTFLLMNYRMEPNSFELHPITVTQDEWDQWNVAMLKFNEE